MKAVEMVSMRPTRAKAPTRLRERELPRAFDAQTEFRKIKEVYVVPGNGPGTIDVRVRYMKLRVPIQYSGMKR